MKVKFQILRVTQKAGKPYDRENPLTPSWEVLMSSDPHIGDIELRTDGFVGSQGGVVNSKEEYEDFVKWASKLKCNQIIEVDFPNV